MVDIEALPPQHDPEHLGQRQIVIDDEHAPLHGLTLSFHDPPITIRPIITQRPAVAWYAAPGRPEAEKSLGGPGGEAGQ
ncbi:hypothetical protein GCM10009810_35080 [Nostocoides vanveenii]|uniref:Uncharacterized protein n=1 Tax=Nostocoides vanveenii TaxID=330835 RepID=A0ABN2L4W4_9MICO